MDYENQGSVLQALVTLESEKLEEYCRSFRIDGAIAQTATIALGRGQQMWASRGALISFSDGIEWAMRVPGGAAKAVGRLLSGEHLALTRISARRPDASVVLSANHPGKLATWDLSRGAIICTSGSFVGALGDVDITVTVAKDAGAALFGGAGFFLQKISGRGIAIVHGSGDFIERHLAAGEKIQVSTGNLAFFSAEVSYGIRGVGGCAKMLFGGEGLFMTELTGPGWVMLQSLKKPTIRRGKAAAE